MIKDMYRKKEVVYSIEVFPPKENTDIDSIFRTLDEMKAVEPDFISVTYGAGGSNSKKTLEIASYIQNQCQVEAVAHLTCAALTPEKLDDFLKDLKEKNVKNVLALRGDRPRDMSEEEFEKRYFKHASDLVETIIKHPLSTIGGACYPEIHPESKNREEDLHYLKHKTEVGVDFLITQMFFDNQVFYEFLDAARKAGIEVPVSAGIMPITAPSQIRRCVELSGSQIPTKLSHLCAKYADAPEDLKKAGLEFAIGQIEDLKKHGVDGIHLYSMNKPDTAKYIYNVVK